MIGGGGDKRGIKSQAAVVSKYVIFAQLKIFFLFLLFKIKIN